MKLHKITSNIIHVKFKSQIEMCETFCRFQEHYESPEFRGKIFTLGQYREWYSEHYGSWSYYTDWNGFNIPDYVLNPFKQGLFDPLSEKEKNFLERFRYRKGKFYIIGTYDSLPEALNHEIAHALYYLDEEYKKEVDQIISKADKIAPAWIAFENFLLEKGYTAEVIDDEIQAFLSSNTERIAKKFELDIPNEAYFFEEVRREYFEKYGLQEI